MMMMMMIQIHPETLKPQLFHKNEHLSTTCHMHTKLEQLEANKSQLLQSYLYIVNPDLTCHSAHYAGHTHNFNHL